MRTSPVREISDLVSQMDAHSGRKILSSRESSLILLAISICKHEEVEAFHGCVLEALENGSSLGDVKELILQLSIYVGFPKALQSLKRLKQLDTSDLSPLQGSLGPCSDLPTYAPSSFNFFECADVQASLHEIDKDFAEMALMNAVPLSGRPGLTPKERALVILASDIYNRAFEGPFQIHTDMLLRSGGSIDDLRGMVVLIETSSSAH
jgi:alkylhydroperoxidase/carboxymuconolactone decarboxylase family protein YurZ